MKITRPIALALLLLPGMLLTAFLWPVSAQTPTVSPATSIAETTFPLTKPIELNNYEVAPLVTVPNLEPSTQLIIKASEQSSPVAAIISNPPYDDSQESTLGSVTRSIQTPLKPTPVSIAHIDTQSDDSFTISSAIYYAVDQGATKIEIALDQQNIDPNIKTAILYATSRGSTIIDTAMTPRD